MPKVRMGLGLGLALFVQMRLVVLVLVLLLLMVLVPLLIQLCMHAVPAMCSRSHDALYSRITAGASVRAGEAVSQTSGREEIRTNAHFLCARTFSQLPLNAAVGDGGRCDVSVAQQRATKKTCQCTSRPL